MQIRFPSTPDELTAWDSFVTSHPGGSHWQLSWWLARHRRRFVTNRIIAVFDGSKIVAGAGLYRFGPAWPAPAVTVVTNAPLMEAGREDALKVLANGLVDEARRNGSMLLQLEAFDAGLTEPLGASLAGRTVHREALWKLYHPGVWREVRILLSGRTPDELLKSFNRLVKRQIKKAEEAGVEVSDASDDEAVRTAHHIWSEGGKRKDYRIRSFSDFRDLVAEAARHGMAHLLVARINGEPASFLFSIFYGCGAVAVSTAFTDQHAEIPSNRYLHWRAMLEAQARGLPYFSLAAPGRDGVRQFKDHFHPELIDNTRFATVVLRPALVALSRGLIGNAKWMPRMKGWVVRRDRRADAVQ